MWLIGGLGAGVWIRKCVGVWVLWMGGLCGLRVHGCVGVCVWGGGDRVGVIECLRRCVGVCGVRVMWMCALCGLCGCVGCDVNVA